MKKFALRSLFFGLMICIASSLVSCQMEPISKLTGEYVCTDVVVTSASASEQALVAECRDCHKLFINKDLSVEAKRGLLRIGFSQLTSGDFKRVKGNLFASGENSKALFTKNKLILDCQQGDYNYRLYFSRQ